MTQNNPKKSHKSEPVSGYVKASLENSRVLNQAAKENLLQELSDRRLLGVKKYSQELHTFNDRDALQDLKEEILDAMQYLKQAELESKVDEPAELFDLLLLFFTKLQNSKKKKMKYKTVKSKQELKELLRQNPDERHVKLDFADASYLYQEVLINFKDLDLSAWDVSNVTSMDCMFLGAKSFNQDISGWNVSNVTSMDCMFSSAESFNQDISNWDVSNVRNMYGTFRCAASFNQPLNDWNVSNVRDMITMFWGAKSFNQDIGNWDVSNVRNMVF